MADSNDDDIIELTQVVDDKRPDDDQDVLELTQVVKDQDSVIELEDESIVTMELPQMDSDAVEISPEKSFDQVQPDLSGMSMEQLEAAIERVVEKKFSRQIEKILFEITEKVIKKEIADIKEGLQRDLDDIDNA